MTTVDFAAQDGQERGPELLADSMRSTIARSDVSPEDAARDEAGWTLFPDVWRSDVAW